MITVLPYVLLLCVCAVPVAEALSARRREALQCDATWGTFGEGDLVQTARNRASEAPLSFHNYNDHHNSWQGLFVQPDLGFAFCPIQKNGCSSWSPVLTKMFFNDSSFDAGKGDTQISMRSQEKYGEEGMERVFRNPHAIRAVFVRDPLARFASAFMDKCITPSSRRANCPALKDGIVFRDAVKWALKENLAMTNPHWKPQAYHCELYKRVHEYNVIALMDKDSYADHAKCLLAQAGLERFNSLRQGVPAFDPHSVPANRGIGLQEADVLKKLFTQDAARALIQRLQIDYDTFHFSTEPAWLADATGEWYESPPIFKTRTLSRHVEEETDDLVDLARAAGYVQ